MSGVVGGERYSANIVLCMAGLWAEELSLYEGILERYSVWSVLYSTSRLYCCDMRLCASLDFHLHQTWDMVLSLAFLHQCCSTCAYPEVSGTSA